MNWFYNDYQKLAQENNDAIAQLSGEGWKTLKNMFEYMTIYNISLFELEVIKKDLIGAIREAEIEGIDFKDTLGMTEKEFCDSLVREETEHIRQERMVLMVRNLALELFGFYTFIWLMWGAPVDYGISVVMLFVGIWTPVWNYVIDYRIRGLCAYRLTDRKKHWLSLIGCGSLGAGYMAGLFYFGAKDIFIVRGNGVVIFLALFMLSAAAFFGNNYYWNRRAEKYNWR